MLDILLVTSCYQMLEYMLDTALGKPTLWSLFFLFSSCDCLICFLFLSCNKFTFHAKLFFFFLVHFCTLLKLLLPIFHVYFFAPGRWLPMPLLLFLKSASLTPTVTFLIWIHKTLINCWLPWMNALNGARSLFLTVYQITIQKMRGRHKGKGIFLWLVFALHF